MTIAIDTREQLPYAFEDAIVTTLKSGDYSIVGLEDKVAVERKSKADAYGSLGRGRARFEREMKRLSKFDYAAVVIEATLEDFQVKPPFSQMNPKSAVATIIAWSVKYKVAVFFAGNRTQAMAVTRHVLRMFWRYHHEEALYGRR